jgi:uncharacterized membrane protein YecN with MAPEG domain
MDRGLSGNAAALWAGLALLLLLALSLLLVRQRQRRQVVSGDGGIDELARAIRAHCNATEYVPAGLAGLAVLVLAGAPPLVIHAAGSALLTGRVVHAVGLSLSLNTSMAPPSACP